VCIRSTADNADELLWDLPSSPLRLEDCEIEASSSVVPSQAPALGCGGERPGLAGGSYQVLLLPLLPSRFLIPEDYKGSLLLAQVSSG